MSGPGLPDPLIWVIFGASLVYGVLFVLPIGGADMPVVISLLNSFTGIAAALGGFYMITRLCSPVGSLWEVQERF